MSVLGVNNNTGLPGGGTRPPPGGPLEICQKIPFQAEDTVDRGHVSVPWVLLLHPHNRACMCLPLSSSLPPSQREPLKALLLPLTNIVPAAQACELRRSCCRRKLERGQSQKLTLASNLFSGPPSSWYLKKNFLDRQERGSPSSSQCCLQEGTNTGQGG